MPRLVPYFLNLVTSSHHYSTYGHDLLVHSQSIEPEAKRAKDHTLFLCNNKISFLYPLYSSVSLTAIDLDCGGIY